MSAVPPIPFLRCPLLMVTGLDCPFCGGTRATLQLLEGHLGTALDYNALWVVAVPLLAWLALAWGVARMGGPRLPTLTLTPRLLRAVGVALVAFAVLRNLPISPFVVLKA